MLENFIMKKGQGSSQKKNNLDIPARYLEGWWKILSLWSVRAVYPWRFFEEVRGRSEKHLQILKLKVADVIFGKHLWLLSLGYWDHDEKSYLGEGNLRFDGWRICGQPLLKTRVLEATPVWVPWIQITSRKLCEEKSVWQVLTVQKSSSDG